MKYNNKHENCGGLMSLVAKGKKFESYLKTIYN